LSCAARGSRTGRGNSIAGRLTSHPLTQDIPVIVITDRDNLGLKRAVTGKCVAAHFSAPIVVKDPLNELRPHVVPSGRIKVPAMI
jgi:hypothetical protein